MGLRGGARPASGGDEARLAAVLPSRHSPLFFSRRPKADPPSPWSAGRLQLPLRPRPFASSFRGSSPTSAPTESPPLPSGPGEKMVAPVRPRYFCCGIRDSTNTPNSGLLVDFFFSCLFSLPDADSSCGIQLKPLQCYLRFEAVTSNSLRLTMSVNV